MSFASEVIQGLLSTGTARGGLDFTNVGAAIGGIPQQRKDQQKKTRFNEIMGQVNAARASGDPNAIAKARTLLEKGGYSEEAQKLVAAEREAQERKDTASINASKTQLLTNTLEIVKNDKGTTPADKVKATNLLKAIKTAGTRGYELEDQVNSLVGKNLKDNFLVWGNNAYNLETGEFLTNPEDATTLKLSDLKDIATNESIIEYVKTENPNSLVFKNDKAEVTEEDVIAKQNFTVEALKTIDLKLETAAKALGMVGDYSEIFYDIAKYIPLTDGKKLAGYVTTLQSNLAFDRLQKMRDESKTGGALGQVSNIELQLLRDNVAALDPSSKNFKDQLDVVIKSYEDFKAALLGQDPRGKRYIRVDGKLYYREKDGSVTDLEELARQKALEEAGRST